MLNFIIVDLINKINGKGEIMNQYISRYARHDTHFNRTDPFSNNDWKEENTIPTWIKWCASIGLIACLVVILFI